MDFQSPRIQVARYATEIETNSYGPNMSDSIAIFFKLRKPVRPSILQFKLRYEITTKMDESGQIRARYSSAMVVRSPMVPKAKFQVTAILSVSSPTDILIDGFLVEINPPACTVGNNVLVQNQVYSASLISLLMLQHWMIENGAPPDFVRTIRLENAEVKSATLTYVFSCKNNESAKSLKSLMKSRGQALANRNIKSGSKKPGFSTGSKTDETIYFNHRDYKIKAYVKEGPTDDGVSIIADGKASDTLYAIGRRSLRVEIELKRSWLEKKGLQCPNGWNTDTGNDLHGVGLQIIQKYLRLDKKYRIRRPSDDHMTKLAPLDREVLLDHLDGGKSQVHPHVKGRRNHLSRLKYFSAVRKRIMEAMAVDIAIGWNEQCSLFGPQLCELMVPENMVRIPPEMSKYCFCSETISNIVNELKVRLRTLAKRGEGAG